MAVKQDKVGDHPRKVLALEESNANKDDSLIWTPSAKTRFPPKLIET